MKTSIFFSFPAWKFRLISIWLFMIGILAVPGFSAKPANPFPASSLRMATFDVDVTPTDGPLSYDPQVNTWDMGLRAKGIVILGSGQPIVLCAIDWLAISNSGIDQFKEAIAKEAGTTRQRVTVNVVHQHDAPRYDPDSEAFLKKAGIDPGSLKNTNFDGRFVRTVIPRLAKAIGACIPLAKPVSHVGLGSAKVSEVASNRHIYGPDGKVKIQRGSSSKIPEAIAAPEGIIDPEVSLVSFWNNDSPVAVLSFYASHPQSYYRTGIPNPDFPGIARFFRQLDVPEALHVHFNGAGGNIGAGKYNNGAPKNRLILAERLADGMKKAWDTTIRQKIGPEDLAWITQSVHIPPSPYLFKTREELKTSTEVLKLSNEAAGKMAWLQRVESGIPMELSCLKLNNARILFMDGELFIEYQLAAKAARPDLFVAMAAYGDLGAGYIGTAASYERGGYEVGHFISGVDGRAEEIILKAVGYLLNH